jgi:hypothetical protein
MINNKIAFITLCLGVIVLGSCQKNFLNVPTQGVASPALDPQLALQEVTAAYNGLITPNPSNTFGDDVHGVSFISATNIISDDADKGSYPGDQEPAEEMDNFTFTSNNVYVENLWRGYYDVIARANQAIRDLPLSAIDSNTVKEKTAEMRFVRAYLYFNLVRMFGGVPLVLTVPTGPTGQDSSFFNRATDSSIYNNAIIPDLQYAVINLPLKGQTDVGRATKGAAEALLAKVYMYTKNWQQAYALSEDVITSNKYQLVADYSTMWRQIGNNDSESIFEIQTGSNGGTDYGVSEYCEFQGPRQDNGMGIPTTPWNNPALWNPTNDLGFGFVAPTANLMSAYEPGDLREAATIIYLPAGGPSDTLFDGTIVPTMVSTTATYNYKAWHSERRDQFEIFFGDRSHKAKNIHILRYAEVLLINAEAATHTGGDVATPLNMVRHRAGLTDAPVADINAVWRERRVELAMEHDRFWDLVRTGRAASVMQASGKSFITGKNELLPIPAAEIALTGGKLKQNPGY